MNSLLGLLSNLLGLFLLLLQERGKVCEPFTGDNEAATHKSLAASNDTVTTALLVLIVVGLEDIISLLACSLEWPVNVVDDCLLDLAGL